MNKQQIKDLQAKIGTVPDGFWGEKSIKAVKGYLNNLLLNHILPTYEQLNDVYGVATKEGTNIINLNVEGLGVKYGDDPVKTIRVNKACSESLLAIIKELSKSDFAYILELYGGCFTYRKMRGGSKLSTHSWGCAIDFDSRNNGNLTMWPVKAKMPLEVMEIFAKHGWKSAGAFWGRDAMHFQKCL